MRPRSRDERGDDRDLVGLEEVGGHAGTVADVVTDVVGNGGGVARVVLRDAGFDLADEVGAHVGGLGEDAAADTHEQGDERRPEAESDEDGRRRVLEDEHDRRGPDEAEADAEQAGDTARAERHLEGRRQLAVSGGGRRADVAPHGQAHPDDAGSAGEERPAEESDGAGEPGLHKGECDVAVRLDDFGGREEDEDAERYDDDGDRPELALEEGFSAFLDGGGDLAHLGRAGIGRYDATHEVDRYKNCHEAGREGEE